MSNEARVYTGADMKGLFSRPSSTDIEIDSKHGKLKFVVRPMNNDIYAKMGEAMKPNDIDLKKITEIEGLKVFSNVYYPALKVVLPYCCIDPQMIDGVSTDEKTLSIQDVPMDVQMELFNKIMEVSGISDKAEDARKN